MILLLFLGTTSLVLCFSPLVQHNDCALLYFIFCGCQLYIDPFHCINPCMHAYAVKRVSNIKLTYIELLRGVCIKSSTMLSYYYYDAPRNNSVQDCRLLEVYVCHYTIIFYSGTKLQVCMIVDCMNLMYSSSLDPPASIIRSGHIILETMVI